MTKRILIVGAASGIGKEVSLQLAAKGYQLALVDMNGQALVEMKALLGSRYPGVRVETEVLNITDYYRVGPVFDELAQRLGGLDIVFANAGIDLGSEVGDADNFPDVRKTIEVNLLGAIACIDKAISLFKKQGHGHIAVTSSLSAIRGMAGNGYAGYSASKSGINRYMESLYAELMRDGLHKSITTGTIMPGHVITPMEDKGMSVTVAAKAIVKAIETRKRSVVITGLLWNIARWLMPILPTRLMLAFD
ncbi:SDR family oxidoreductase [Maricurvus nonylphenolicus]|uniref:SDR family NAD(P)-dependent oxidoreductase n=1 Tax=Maricurvus nonylphenolicus TaxID=1008307 RepID=UPI0036F2FF14